MIKKIIIIIISGLLIISVSVFVYRYQILQYTAEALIRKYLPNYIKIDTIRFDFRRGDILLGGLKILNPPEFSKEYLAEIEKITCHYEMQGKNIVDGIELNGPILSGAVLNIERLGDGKVNLVEVQALIGKRSPAAVPGKETVERKAGQGVSAQAAQNKSLTGMVKIPETFRIKDSKIILMDRMTRATPSIITFEKIDAEFTLKMDESYTKMLALYSVGSGCVNGDSNQAVKWTISVDPTTPRLTMSNRFEVSGVHILPFEPYYDKYSPIVIKDGRFSGLLVFDFDNGMIGSTDELRLNSLKFSVKQGYENAEFWETTVPDLVKYLTSPYGEIIFDFKIKGDMSDPKFYLGPKSKEAIVSIAVDKISDALQKNSGSNGAPKNDIEKAKQYIDMFKGFIKK